MEDVSCDLTWREMGSAMSTYPRHTMHECINASPALKPDMWWGLVSDSNDHIPDDSQGG